jgi:thiamine kinase
MQAELVQALSQRSRWPIEGELQSPPTEIKGGLTNRSYLLNINGHQYRLRLNTPAASSLGINRAREVVITKAVHQIGLSPALLFSGDNFSYSLFEYLPGRTWTAADFRNPSQRARLEPIVKQYQALKFDITPRDYIAYLDAYWQQIRDHDILSQEDTERYFEFQVQLEMRTKTWPKFVLSHHDLIPENIIESEAGLTILDWEYASLGHPKLDERHIELIACGAPQHAPDILDQLIHWLNTLWSAVCQRN